MRAFRIAYDGRPYHGFQRQPDVPTVEDELFDALRRLDVCNDEPENYSAAGRTDAGVSALAQTVAFECPDWLSPAALNGELPEAIRAWGSADVVDFHATHDAISREYVYHLYASDLNDRRARRAAEALSGEHDFHNLTPDETGTVRDLSIDLDREDDFMVCTLSADGFPRQLVRRVVSLLHEVATGEADLARIDRVLSDESLDGPAGVAPASAHPLVLHRVEYDVEFEVDPDAAETARSVFEDRRIEHATGARVADSVVRGITRRNW